MNLVFSYKGNYIEKNCEKNTFEKLETTKNRGGMYVNYKKSCVLDSKSEMFLLNDILHL